MTRTNEPPRSSGTSSITPSTIFSSTLHSITTTKLLQLSKKRSIFESQKDSILTAAAQRSDQHERLQVLLDGIISVFGSQASSGPEKPGKPNSFNTGDFDLDNRVNNWVKLLQHAQYDSSISPSLMNSWEDDMRHVLKVKASRFQFAVLFGELVREWLLSSESSSGEPDAADEDLEHVENLDFKERDEQRSEWEDLVFNPLDLNKQHITDYLLSLFGKHGEEKLIVKALTKLRVAVQDFEVQMAEPNQFDKSVMAWVIQGLLDIGLFSKEKQSVLRDFKNNDVILAEVADVLNMRISDLDNWSWESEVLVEQRRHVTGRYHIYMHEDLLQAMFLHYIGVKWSVFFKRAFRDFVKSEDVWESQSREISLAERRRREEYLGTLRAKKSLAWKRQGINKRVFLLSQLLDDEYTDLGADADGAEEADYELGNTSNPPVLQLARMSAAAPSPSVRKQKMAGGGAKRHRRILVEEEIDYSDEEPDDSDNDADIDSEIDVSNSKMQKKKLILRLLATELHINSKLYGEFTCARSEFKQWGPSLPHSSIQETLSFLGVSKKWLHFFRRFLEAPLKFTSSSSSETETPQIRKRGVPQSHILSDFFGEILLFCLDYSINQSAPSATLSRLHDDFWIWGKDHESVVHAWLAVTKFCATMGVSLNPSKSGSVRIAHPADETLSIDPALPRGDIRWGFLLLDPKSGRFVLDRTIIDHHISSLRRQLKDKEKKSIFEWVQAWNTFAGVFFSTNFGEAANCFGGRFVDDILTTLSHIQSEIFGEGGSVEGWLKAEVRKRFGHILGTDEEIPDGWIWFDMKRGGLEVKNMFIPYLQLHGGVEADLDGIITRYLDDEKEAYRKARVAWEKKAKDDRDGTATSRSKHVSPWHSSEVRAEDQKDQFMALEEFQKYREDFHCAWEGNLKSVFDHLLERGRPKTLDAVDTRNSGRGTGYSDPYWKWVTEVYRRDMIDRFGDLGVVDQGLLPIGMVELFRSGRVEWQG